MYYTIKTDKSFAAAAEAVDRACRNHGFGVLHVHDLGETLRGKGIDTDCQCKVFEVCNPRQAARVLDIDLDMNMALPCRISVYRKGEQTVIGMIRPQWLLEQLSDDAALAAIAREVETDTCRIIDEAGG